MPISRFKRRLFIAAFAPIVTLVVLIPLLRFSLDGVIVEPLSSILEEITGIRPRGIPSVEFLSSPFATPPSPSFRSDAPRSPPVMGWNSWNTFQCDISEDLILSTASSLVSSGLAAKGYTYVNIDDCWQTSSRDSSGSLVADPARFPRGIKALADDVHSMGLKLGIYSDYGLKTCAGFPGSYGHYEQDAATFASWHVDLLKFDRCAPTPHQDENPARYFRQMKAALDATGRDIKYSICNWGRADKNEGAPWLWAADGTADMWRTTADIFPSFHRVLSIMSINGNLATVDSRAGYNDPDMLEIGVKGTYLNVPMFPSIELTKEESLIHFVMWAMFSSPLIIGADLRSSPEWVFEILGHEEIIGLNQDKLGDQAVLVREEKTGWWWDLNGGEYWGTSSFCFFSGCAWTQVWAKRLEGDDGVGAFAVAFLNLGFDFQRRGGGRGGNEGSGSESLGGARRRKQILRSRRSSWERLGRG